MKNFLIATALILTTQTQAASLESDIFLDSELDNLEKVMSCTDDVRNTVFRQKRLVHPTVLMFQQNLKDYGVSNYIKTLSEVYFMDHDIELVFVKDGYKEGIESDQFKDKTKVAVNNLFRTLYTGANLLQPETVVPPAEIEIQFPAWTDKDDVRISFPTDDLKYFSVQSEVEFARKRNTPISPDDYTLVLRPKSEENSEITSDVEINIVFTYNGETKYEIFLPSEGDFISVEDPYEACQTYLEAKEDTVVVANNETDEHVNEPTPSTATETSPTGVIQ